MEQNGADYPLNRTRKCKIFGAKMVEQKGNKLFSIKTQSAMIIVALFIILNLPVHAQFLNSGGNVTAKLISEVTSIQPGGSFWVAVHMKMQKGWHTYWKNPGDSGLPTEITWNLPDGLNASGFYWPVPEKIESPPLVSYGYHSNVYLLTEITANSSLKIGEKLTISGNLEWLECKEACIPGEEDISINLPVKDKTPQAENRWLKIFADTRAQLPLINSDWQINVGEKKGLYSVHLQQPDWYDGQLGDLEFYPYDENSIDITKTQVFKQVGNSYILEIPVKAEIEQQPDSLLGILVSSSGWRGSGSEKAIEVRAAVQSNTSFMPISDTTASGIGLNILFSFLGGIILNLMPCVLPVLSIKIMSFVQQANDTESKPWQHGLVFTLGVLISFWVLAGALLILQAGGEQLGWGFQLQSPVFLIFLSAFIFLFGLSMFGVFEIGASLTTVGGKTQGMGGWMGSFVSGVTATVVATPCTAPFMGSALGYALSQPSWVAMTIFTFLGLGMAFPYVLLSSIPKLLSFVPKPGRWMESMKEFMGFLLMATVLWLLWVLSIQSGSMMVIIILGLMLVLSLSGWIYGRWGNLAMPKRTRIISTSLALIMVIVSLYFSLKSVDSFAVTPGEITTVSGKDGIKWQPFSPENLEQLKAEGKPIFLDFTAAWCLSCQVNESVAFGSQKVQQRFEQLGISAVKADWTLRDETITQALAQYGRNSVPLYVYYPEGEADNPVILPEIITPGIVLDVLK